MGQLKGVSYRIYSSKHRGALSIFSVSYVALIRGQHLFEGGAF